MDHSTLFQIVEEMSGEKWRCSSSQYTYQMVEEIFFAKCEGAVDESTLIRWLKEFPVQKFECAVDHRTLIR